MGVSVLMSVYDDAEGANATIESVLRQTGMDLQLVIVDDGATQEVKQNAANWVAKDDRITIMEQSNQGLTKALINGAELCRHGYIARIDSGDVCLPGRLEKQAACLDADESLAFVGGDFEWVAPRGELMFTVRCHAKQIASSLREADPANLVGPGHVVVMFRKAAYVACGGYREQFYYAQDVDLWLRMIDQGDFKSVDQTVVKAVFTASGASGQFRMQQAELKRLAAQSAQLRRLGRDDSSVLDRAAQVVPAKSPPTSNIAAGWYFIARAVHRSDRRAARYYYRQALDAAPMLVKAWLSWLISSIR